MSNHATTLIVSAAVCACAALVLRMIQKAPEAHESDKGFRLGPPETSEGKGKSDSKVA